MLFAPTVASSGALDGYRWERRLLLLFAPEDAVAIGAQRAAIDADRAGFDDRDLTLIVISGDAARAADDGARFDADALRARYGLAPTDVASILIGKDGAEKRRVRDGVMMMNVLFAAIDVMPMRRREMEARR